MRKQALLIKGLVGNRFGRYDLAIAKELAAGWGGLINGLDMAIPGQYLDQRASAHEINPQQLSQSQRGHPRDGRLRRYCLQPLHLAHYAFPH